MFPKMVQLRKVVKQYSKERYALRNINFELARGEFAYVTGTNGAGKSTLLKLLFGMERPSEGSILVNNNELSNISDKKIHQYRREVGYVFQDFKLLPDLNVYQNVAMPLVIRKMDKKEIDFRVKGVLNLVGLSDRDEEHPTRLSGGEQQRVAIARSIVGKPVLLLADEPTGNLDSRTARDIMTLFQEIQDMGTTVLIATHDEALMQEFPSRIIELDKGLMVSDRGMA